jgi:hypothetical protein
LLQDNNNNSSSSKKTNKEKKLLQKRRDRCIDRRPITSQPRDRSEHPTQKKRESKMVRAFDSGPKTTTARIYYYIQ